MKTLLIGCAAIAAIFSIESANAADLPRPAPAPYYKAPAMVPPVSSWTGFYIGMEGGYGWGSESYTDNTLAPATATYSHSPAGGIFGGLLGYRYQIGQIVLGAEGSAAWTDITDTATLAGNSEAFKVRSMYTATGQIGYAFNQVLLYAKGGWAGAYVRNSLTTAALTATNSQDDNGWTVGAGLDYAVWQNVVLGVEYDHMDFGYGGFSAATSIGGTPWTVSNTSRFTVDQVVGRLTYKFNF